MKLSNLMIASLGAVALMGCDDGDKTPSNNTPDTPSVYSVENTLWDLNSGVTSANGLQTTAIADIIAYHFDSGTHTVKIYEPTYYTTSSYDITPDDSAPSDPDFGEIEFDYDGQAVTCDFDASNNALSLSNCSPNEFEVIAAGGLDPDSTEASDLVGHIEQKPSDGSTPAALNEYKFEEDFDADSQLPTDSGEAGDDITSISQGDETADPIESAIGALGETGTAMYLDQDTSTVYMYYTDNNSSATALTQGSFSIETVINRERSSTASDVALIDYANTDLYKGFKLYIEQDGGTSDSDANFIKFKVYGGCTDGAEPVNGECVSGESTEVVSTAAINDGEWYHIAGVYNADASEAYLYINGDLVATKSVSFTLAENTGDKFILLGGATSSDKNFAGTVDNIATWDAALTADQITERVAMFTPGQEPQDGPLNEYKFEEDFDADSLLPTDSGEAGDDITSISQGDETADPIESAIGALGETGTAMYLDQDTSTVYMYYTDNNSSATALTQGSFSVETVINRERSSTASDVALIDYANTDLYKGFKLYIEQDGGASDSDANFIKFKVYGGCTDGAEPVNGECASGESTEVVSTAAINNDEWYHIAGVYNADASEAYLYINGDLVATKSVSFTLAENTGDKFILLGGATSSDKNFAGTVDNIATWDRALTKAEVGERVADFGL